MGGKIRTLHPGPEKHLLKEKSCLSCCLLTLLSNTKINEIIIEMSAFAEQSTIEVFSYFCARRLMFFTTLLFYSLECWYS